MSVESTEALERSVLESKDREQLLAIAGALGVKATSRAKKADIIAKILEQTGSGAEPAPEPEPKSRARNGNGHRRSSAPTTALVEPAEAVPAADGSPEEAPQDVAEPVDAVVTVVTPDLDAEPLAEWELAMAADAPNGNGDAGVETGRGPSASTTTTAPEAAPSRPSAGSGPDQGDGGGQSSRRRRRRNRDRNRGDGPQGVDRFTEQPSQGPAEAPFQGEPVDVDGYLDLRDEGYGFLRVKGYLPTEGRRVRLGEAGPPVRPAQGRPRQRHGAARRPRTRRTRRCCASTP